ncbi:MAG: sel1 repeat family protein [Geobacteraceae bacterium]|nr:sel1 repeat family protein [Geobacteraceae bacterium]
MRYLIGTFLILMCSLSYAWADTELQQKLASDFDASVKEKKYPAAYAFAEKYVKSGAKDRLFIMYKSMGGISLLAKSDPKKAVNWLEKAIELNKEPGALYLLGKALDELNRYDESFSRFTEASEAGDPSSMLILANDYEMSLPPAPYSPYNALYWYKKWKDQQGRNQSLDKEVDYKIEKLGKRLANLNRAESIDLSRLGDEGQAGNLTSINKLIYYYTVGAVGIAADSRKSGFWVKVGKAYGEKAGEMDYLSLAESYRDGDGTSKSETNALKWYLKASALGSSRASIDAADIYRNRNDNSAARNIYVDQCDRFKDKYSCFNASILFVKSEELQKSTEYARKSGDAELIRIVNEAVDDRNSIKFVNVSADVTAGFSSCMVTDFSMSNLNGRSDSDSPGNISNNRHYAAVHKGYNGGIAGRYRWSAKFNCGNEYCGGVVSISGAKSSAKINFYKDCSSRIYEF